MLQLSMVRPPSGPPERTPSPCRLRDGTLEAMARWVLHVDLDQFIAAVEILRRPELAGVPVVVGGRGDPTERAVVSTASYEARAFGVGSGMPLRLAARKCPDAVFLPVDASGVRRGVGAWSWRRCAAHAGRGRPGARLGRGVRRRRRPDDVRRPSPRDAIRAEVLEATRLHCSVGVGDTKVRAKIATDFGKPQGDVRAHPGQLVRGHGRAADDGAVGVGAGSPRGWPRTATRPCSSWPTPPTRCSSPSSARGWDLTTAGWVAGSAPAVIDDTPWVARGPRPRDDLPGQPHRPRARSRRRSRALAEQVVDDIRA